MTERTQMRNLVSAELQGRYRYIYGRLLAFLRKRLQLSPLEAEEIAQEAMLRAINHAETYKPPPGGTFISWLLTIARNAAYDEHRARKVRLAAAVEHAVGTMDHSVSADHELGDAIAAQNRDRIVAALSPELRLVFRLWVRQELGELDAPAAAAELGCSVSELNNAKKRVRTEVRNVLRALALDVEDIKSHRPILIGLAGAGRDKP